MYFLKQYADEILPNDGVSRHCVAEVGIAWVTGHCTWH